MVNKFVGRRDFQRLKLVFGQAGHGGDIVPLNKDAPFNHNEKMKFPQKPVWIVSNLTDRLNQRLHGAKQTDPRLATGSRRRG